MYNWSVDEEAMKKADPEKYKIWRLEQMIHYGEEGDKLNERELKKYWPIISDRIDPAYRRYLELLLWPNHHRS
ncbi:hypothetical protein HY623_02200 [Candidatus Uhrbacteria bacterium]|nr:hypothetical protein [Candidatus Uhrbacteria bacterium]